jgi:hypothetical protein
MFLFMLLSHQLHMENIVQLDDFFKRVILLDMIKYPTINFSSASGYVTLCFERSQKESKIQKDMLNAHVKFHQQVKCGERKAEATMSFSFCTKKGV